MKHTVLSYPDDSKKYIVGTDASNYGLGAWIGQYHGNNLRILSYASRSLSPAERKYSPTKMELLAVVFAVEKFSNYVSTQKFELRTDHRALTFLFTQKYPNTMILNWFDKLMGLDFDIVHVPGNANAMADPLSRFDEPMSLATFSVQHLVRDKVEPAGERERRTLVERAHNFGHFGEQAVFKKIWHDGFWWKNIRQEIADVIADCTPCQRYNVAKKGFHPPRYITADLPWDHLSIDLVTPLPLSEGGMDTLLVIVNVMTKFCVLRCLKGKGMTEIARNLWEVISLLGVPKIMQFDNGSEFVNQVIEELVKLNGIDHRTISSYNPRANGQVERVNQVIETLLKKEVHGAMHEWPDFVPYVQLAYNAKISTTTGSTPFSLMFGRRLNEFQKYGRSTTETDMSMVLWKNHQQRVRDVVYPAVKSRVLEKKGAMVENFARKNRMLKEDAFPKGAVVMMIDKTKESKWDPLYEGPFTVIRQNRGGAYILKDKLGETLKRTVPADQLKLVKRHGDDAFIESPTFEVATITNHRYDDKKRFEYYVEWKDKNIEPSWEPVANFHDIDVIKQYWKKVRPTRKKKKGSKKHK